MTDQPLTITPDGTPDPITQLVHHAATKITDAGQRAIYTKLLIDQYRLHRTRLALDETFPPRAAASTFSTPDNIFARRRLPIEPPQPSGPVAALGTTSHQPQHPALSTASPDTSAEPEVVVEAQPLELGQRVRALDRNNIGTVIATPTPTTYTIGFTSRRGYHAERNFERDQLVPVSSRVGGAYLTPRPTLGPAAHPDRRREDLAQRQAARQVPGPAAPGQPTASRTRAPGR